MPPSEKLSNVTVVEQKLDVASEVYAHGRSTIVRRTVVRCEFAIVRRTVCAGSVIHPYLRGSQYVCAAYM